MMELPNLITLLSSFLALAAGLDRKIGGEGTDYPVLPRKPYGATAFLVDYGMLIDDYGYVLSSDSELSNTALRASIRVFLAPLKEYQSSISQEGTVSNARRKEHLVGQAAYLAKDKSFRENNIEFSDWKDANMWNSVTSRSTFNDALATRNGLFSNITGGEALNNALGAYQVAMKNYTKILNGTAETEFEKLVAKDLDWNLFESRYYELVRSLKSSGGDADKAAVVRAYLTGFLRDGDSNEDAYNEIVKTSSTRDDYSASKTKTSTRYRSTATSTKRTSRVILGDDDITTSTDRFYKRVVRNFDFWSRSSSDFDSRTKTKTSTRTNTSTKTSTSTSTKTRTTVTTSGSICASSTLPVETIEIRAGGAGQTQTVQCSCTTRGKRPSDTVSASSTSSRSRWFTSDAPPSIAPTLVALFISAALGMLLI